MKSTWQCKIEDLVTQNNNQVEEIDMDAYQEMLDNDSWAAELFWQYYLLPMYFYATLHMLLGKTGWDWSSTYSCNQSSEDRLTGPSLAHFAR